MWIPRRYYFQGSLKVSSNVRLLGRGERGSIWRAIGTCWRKILHHIGGSPIVRLIWIHRFPTACNKCASQRGENLRHLASQDLKLGSNSKWIEQNWGTFHPGNHAQSTLEKAPLAWDLKSLPERRRSAKYRKSSVCHDTYVHFNDGLNAHEPKSCIDKYSKIWKKHIQGSSMMLWSVSYSKIEQILKDFNPIEGYRTFRMTKLRVRVRSQ